MTIIDPQAAEAATTAAEPDVAVEESLADRLFGAMLGALDLYAIYLGERLGWYEALRAHGPLTAGQLAERTGTNARYCREWLEQQAVSGMLDVDASPDAHARIFTLPAETAEAVLDESSLSYIGPIPRFLVGSAQRIPELLEAYRHGGGVGWGEYGADARESQAAMNRPWYDQQLAGALASMPGVHDLLSRDGVRVADIGCGGGWSTMAIARAYPHAQVQGYDIDPPSVDLARENAEAVGMADSVAFTVADGGDMPSARFDVVFAFECIHDMPHPVEVLAAARRSLRPGGSMIVMDEAVADEFAAPGDELERMMYGFSLLICLPDGMSHPDSEATGTVMRQSTLESYARRAGFSTCERVPIDQFGFWRFYQLTP